jgi:predicted transcriptional regulator
MTEQPATVDDHMVVDVVAFRPATEIHTAIRVLVEKRISGAPVTDNNGRLVGILTQKDCLEVVYSTSYHQDWGGQVKDYMTADVEVIISGTSIIAAADRFMHSQFRRFPVVQNDRMIGLICRSEVLRAIQDMWPRDE